MEVLLGLGRVSGLVSFLIASAIFAAIGTAVRGLLRPISWALLTLALVLMISNRLAGIPAEGGDSSIQPGPSSDRPVAQEGWQDVARDLEPVYSDTLTDPTDTVTTRPTNSDNNNGSRDNSSTAASGQTANSRARQSAATSGQSSSPILGLW